MPRVKPNSRYYSTNKRRDNPPLRRAVTLGLAGCVLFGGIVLLWNNGWPQRQAQRAVDALLGLTAYAGLSLQEVNIEGRDHISKDDLLGALQVARGMPILAFDRHAMMERLQALPWLSDAVIERRWPDTLIVRLIEREPLARWQYQGHVQVIDRDGVVIRTASAKEFADLPLIVGAGGAERAYELLALLAPYPQIHKVLRAAICIGERRWDLQLEPGVTIRLPEDREADGLRRLVTLLNDPQILTREVQAVDLRFPDRLIVERPPGSGATKTASGATKL